jgi:hypothetical protein
MVSFLSQGIPINMVWYRDFMVGAHARQVIEVTDEM